VLSGLRQGIVKTVRQPLVQFLVLGTVFYGLYAWRGGSGAGEPDKVILVTAVEVSRLDAAWRARWNRAPTQEELTGIVKDYVQEIALYRHAVAMGLDQNDAVVRRMLGRKLLGLAQNLLEFSLAPTDQDLRTYFDENVERYQPPDLITITTLFIDPDKRGDETLEDAQAILDTLRSLGRPTDGVAAHGDPFMLQSYYPQKSNAEIARLFGQGFSGPVFDLAPGEWHGPVLSGYGVHLVYVHQLVESPAPDFADVQEQVKQEWLEAKRRELQEQYVKDVIDSYDVVFEDLPDPAPVEETETPQEPAQ